jgi:hypothetical protein
VLLVAAFVAVGWFVGKHFREARSGPKGATRSAERSLPAGTKADAPADSATDMLSRIFDRLRSGNLQPGELAFLRRRLLESDPQQAIGAILAFLASGKDARTGEKFEIGKGGELVGAPTFRVMLLDLLGRISRESGSPDAAIFSRALLDRKTSADEWAIALRNIAWSTPSERAFLAGKVREMLTYQPWRQQPGAGFLEAFDLVVFTRDVTLVPDLGEMVGGEDDALRRAAAAAMDRLSEMAPLDVMTYLNANPTEFADRPFLRADYYSKADLSSAPQRQAVETYLSRTDVTAAEKDKLLSVFVSPGTFVDDTLVTERPAADESPQRIAGLRTAVGEWLKSNRFPELRGPLTVLERTIGK